MTSKGKITKSRKNNTVRQYWLNIILNGESCDAYGGYTHILKSAKNCEYNNTPILKELKNFSIFNPFSNAL